MGGDPPYIRKTAGMGDGEKLFLVNVNGTLFFDTRDIVHGWELWRSDGTAAGTRLVRDINPWQRELVPRLVSRLARERRGNALLQRHRSQPRLRALEGGALAPPQSERDASPQVSRILTFAFA